MAENRTRFNFFVSPLSTLVQILALDGIYRALFLYPYFHNVALRDAWTVKM